MKYLSIFIIAFFGFFLPNSIHAQIKENLAELPVNIIPAKKTGGETMVLLITGDGGWNTFSQKLAEEYAVAGIPVVALNSLKYFWKKRTPEESAAAISILLNKYSAEWKTKTILLCGYSFGADVMPFIYTRLPENLKEKISRIQLLSPSRYTDFEIHISYLFISKKMNVATEIEKINKPVICYYGTSENEKPLKDVVMKNFKIITLKGDHHYENSFTEIVETGLK
jgi:type IV secretory pathway VirJ component